MDSPERRVPIAPNHAARRRDVPFHRGQGITVERRRQLARTYANEIAWAARIGDSLCVVTTLAAALAAYGHEWANLYSAASVVAAVLFMLCAEMNGIYRSWRSMPLREEFVAIGLSWLCVCGGLLLLGYVTKTTHLFSRLGVGTWFIAAPMAVFALHACVRLALRSLRKRGYNTRRVAIAGGGEMAAYVAQVIERSPWMGLELVGSFDDRGRPRNGETETASAANGSFVELLALAASREVDVIYVTLPLNATQRLLDLIGQLSDTTVSVYVTPDLFLLELLNGRWTQFGELPAVSVYETPFMGVSQGIKRLEDIVIASIALLLSAVPMLAIAAAIRLSSPGSVLFRQRRYGLDGRPFHIYKFRTMNVAEDGGEIHQAKRGDPRTTPIGAFLRRHSLDELPQLFNVLEGAMSVVGPRPHAVAHNEHYRGLIRAYMIRHKVKPGITGWAQVNGYRGETARTEQMEGRVEHDLWYMRNWSLFLDLRIVFLTLLVGFRDPDAY